METRIQTATASQIAHHLMACQGFFIPPLIDRVNIEDYSIKIRENAVTFEFWSSSHLAGLLAIYCNNLENKIAYITSISVLPEYRGLGISSILMRKAINYVVQKGFFTIHLEVHSKNDHAINLYKKFNFSFVEKCDDFYTLKLNLM